MGQPVFFKASLSAVCPCTGLSTPDRTMPHVDLTPCFRCCCCCYCRLGCCAVGDIYPEGVQLKKGDYVIRAILRHDDAGLLDKLKVGGWAGGRAGRRAGGPPLSNQCFMEMFRQKQLSCPVCQFASACSPWL